MKNITIRDSGNKEVLEAYFLNHEGQPYNLENKTVTFMENKDGDKFVSDPNVQIVNATAGFVRYTLQSQVHSASGIAWFEINDNSGLVDSTGNFNIRVENGLRATADNTTYIAALEKLKQQMEALIRQADGDLKAELQKAERQLTQELQNFRNQYNSLSNDFQNQFKAAQNARQQDYNNQKNAINADWGTNKHNIWVEWNSNKDNINKQATDTINSIKNNAKQVLDKDQADWNAKQHSWDDTFSRIVKEWQVKTNSLNATVQDLTTKFGNIINELADLMNKKLPDMNAKTDAVQKKVDQLRASLGQIDWTTFARKTDNSGGVNLLANTATLKGFNNAGNSGSGTGFSIDNQKPYLGEPGGSQIRTKVFHAYGSDANHAPVYFGQSFTLPAGTWTLSFLARHYGKSNEKIHVSFYTDDCANRNWAPLGNTSDIDNVWRKYQITFSTTQTTYEQNPRVHCPTPQGIPGGSLFFANFKLEAGSIATDWCQSYLDFDRLDGRHDPVDAPDFNSLTNTGTYLITQPDHGQNYPVAIWGILKVDNAHDSRIEQTYYADQQDAVYYRQCVDGTWKLWRRYANQNYVDDNLNKIKFRNQALDKDGNKFDNFQSIAKQSDGSYRLSTFDSDWTAYHVNWLLNHTKAYTINDNADLNNYKQPGFYNATGTSGIKNSPVGSWFALSVNASQWNGEQTLYDTNSHLTYVRTWNSSGFTAWHQIAYQDDLNVKVVKGFNIETNKPNDPVTMNVNAPWLVDQTTLATFANAHRDVRNHTDYRYPTDQAWNTAINLNSDPYLDTGIYKIGNCATINGPWPDTSRRWFYLTVIKYDDNTIYQTVDQGPERFVRTVSKTRNSYPQWDQFATMNRVVQNVSSVSGNLQAFITDQTKFQKRVDYENPTGTISNETVNFNDYRQTGILKIVNCLIQNGPYKSNNRHSVFLKITNLDGQTQYQTVYEGDNLYGRKLYNGSGQWHKYTNTPI